MIEGGSEAPLYPQGAGGVAGEGLRGSAAGQEVTRPHQEVRQQQDESESHNPTRPDALTKVLVVELPTMEESKHYQLTDL